MDFSLKSGLYWRIKVSSFVLKRLQILTKSAWHNSKKSLQRPNRRCFSSNVSNWGTQRLLIFFIFESSRKISPARALLICNPSGICHNLIILSARTNFYPFWTFFSVTTRAESWRAAEISLKILSVYFCFHKELNHRALLQIARTSRYRWYM